MAKHVFNPDLKFIRKDYRGNLTVNGRFVNEDRQFDLTYGKLLRWVFSANPQRAEKKRDTYQLIPKPDYSIFKDGPDAFVWLGHAAFLFRINNKRILTDPCLYNLGLLKRQFPSPFSSSELKPSRLHPAHAFAPRSFRHAQHAGDTCRKSRVQIYCSLKMSNMVRAVGGRNITEAGWYQEFPSDASGIRFVFLPAKHWNRRFVHDTNRELWGAFWIGTEKQSIYFAGDTAYHSHFTDAKEILPPIKHAFMPIGAYKPDFIMKHSHTSPEEAIQAFRDLGAEYFVPMHYGTYDLSNEPLSEPMKIVTAQLEKEKMFAGEMVPGVNYLL